MDSMRQTLRKLIAQKISSDINENVVFGLCNRTSKQDEKARRIFDVQKKKIINDLLNPLK